jgi:hypothetical protein
MISSKYHQADAAGMAAAAPAAGMDACGSGVGGLRWSELHAELQAMDGDLDAAEAALQAATARLGTAGRTA